MNPCNLASEGLPASWYSDPQILGEERERIFRKTWQYIGRTEQLSRVGDFITGEVGDLPVVVVAGETGLRAFLNVCRHRRHSVMTGSGNRKSLQCPYHAWTYDLNGCLKAAPRADREKGFRLEDFPLVPVRIDTWGQLVFVNADVNARPLADYLGDLPVLLARNGLDWKQLEFRAREEWRTEANWKVMIENYLECYHCPVAHPGFSSVIDVAPGAYQLQAAEWFSFQSAPALEGKGEPRRAGYYFLWPNFTININPGPANLSVDVWFPDGPEHTRGYTEYFFGRDVGDAVAKEWMAFSEQVRLEDEALTASVQRGLRAAPFVAGRLLAHSEQLLTHFHGLVRAALS